MCANNLDCQIATYVDTTKPHNFDTLMSRQEMWKDNLPIRKVYNLRGRK